MCEHVRFNFFCAGANWHWSDPESHGLLSCGPLLILSFLLLLIIIRSCLVFCGCKWEIGGALGGRAGHSVINVPIAVIVRLMTSLSDGVLGARPRGARLKRLQAPPPPVINSARLFAKI